MVGVQILTHHPMQIGCPQSFPQPQIAAPAAEAQKCLEIMGVHVFPRSDFSMADSTSWLVRVPLFSNSQATLPMAFQFSSTNLPACKIQCSRSDSSGDKSCINCRLNFASGKSSLSTPLRATDSVFGFHFTSAAKPASRTITSFLRSLSSSNPFRQPLYSASGRIVTLRNFLP